MAFMPSCNAKSEDERRCLKLKTGAAPAFAASESKGNTCTQSRHLQSYMVGSTERAWQSYGCGGQCFSKLLSLAQAQERAA